MEQNPDFIQKKPTSLSQFPETPDSILQNLICSTQKTQKTLENFEKDVKHTMDSILFNNWDQENQEIITQFSTLADQSTYLKSQIIQKDVEIFTLREILADKQKSLKKTRAALNPLKSLIQKAEDSLVLST